MRTPNPNFVAWADLESTDNDPTAPHAAILEAAVVITDWTPELNVIASASMLIRPAGLQSDHDMMWNRMPPVVREMHTANGLWREATTSDDAWSMHEADAAIAAWVVEQTGGDPLPLAGSGVGHLDLPFVKAFMPKLATRLTYWPLDIGNVRRMLDLAGRADLVDLVTDVDAKPHRALGDVNLHIAEARRYLGLLAAIPHTDTLVDDQGGQTEALFG